MTPDLIAAYVVIVGIPLWLVVETIMSRLEPGGSQPAATKPPARAADAQAAAGQAVADLGHRAA